MIHMRREGVPAVILGGVLVAIARETSVGIAREINKKIYIFK